MAWFDYAYLPYTCTRCGVTPPTEDEECNCNCDACREPVDECTCEGDE